MFIPYKNINNDSNVSSYEIGSDYIAVMFSNGSVYVYSYRKAGKYHVDRMKALAVSGDGLNSYIVRNCSKLYD